MASTAAKADAVREEYEDACNKVEAIKVCGEGILLLLLIFLIIIMDILI